MWKVLYFGLDGGNGVVLWILASRSGPVCSVMVFVCSVFLKKNFVFICIVCWFRISWTVGWS